MVTSILQVCKPLYSILSRWILDGELEDPFNEFFIQTNPHVNSNDQLWHDKYKVRSVFPVVNFNLPNKNVSKMVFNRVACPPGKVWFRRSSPWHKHAKFLRLGRASTSCGKFVRIIRPWRDAKSLAVLLATVQVRRKYAGKEDCAILVQSVPPANLWLVAENFVRLFFCPVEAMFPAERDSDLHSLMDNTYLEVSRRVLDVLNTKYKFMEHMQALRRYLLLGQGDFIRHLMDLLEYVQTRYDYFRLSFFSALVGFFLMCVFPTDRSSASRPPKFTLTTWRLYWILRSARQTRSLRMNQFYID